MAKKKLVLWALLCGSVLALSACATESERRGQSSAGTGQAVTGQSRSQISQVQQALKAKGYDPGTTDGVMGAQTQEALTKFQQANGLPVTGTIDAQTAKALGVSTSGSASGSASESSSESSGESRSRGGGGD
jgi:His-Xaa-Ser repeat protein HxsA